MAVLRFFRVPKHQQYDYKPRYWDPKKEELEERLQEIEDRKGKSIDAVKARLSGGLRRGGYHTDGRYRKRQVARSNLMLVAIIAVLVLISYLLLVQLPGFMEVLENGNGGGQ